jgi:hypothetical protein
MWNIVIAIDSKHIVFLNCRWGNKNTSRSLARGQQLTDIHLPCLYYTEDPSQCVILFGVTQCNNVLLRSSIVYLRKFNRLSRPTITLFWSYCNQVYCSYPWKREAMSSSLGCWKNWDVTREVDGHFKAETNQTIPMPLLFSHRKGEERWCGQELLALSILAINREKYTEVGHRITSLQSIQSTHVLNCGWGNKNHTWVTEGQQQHLATTKDKEINTKLWSFYKNISTLLQLRLAFLENERPYLRLWVGVDNWDVSLER